MNIQIIDKPSLVKKNITATKSAITSAKKAIQSKYSTNSSMMTLYNKLLVENKKLSDSLSLLNNDIQLKKLRLKKVDVKNKIIDIKSSIRLYTDEIKQLKIKLAKIKIAEIELEKYDNYINNLQLTTRIIKIDSNSNKKINHIIHGIELRKLKRQYPNSIYRQSIIYYNDDGSIFNNDPILIYDKKNILFESEVYEFLKIDKSTIQRIYYDQAYGIWKPALFWRLKKGGYCIIKTEAFDRLVFKDNNLQKAKQIYMNNETKSCVVDACLQYLKVKMATHKHAKASYNKLIKNYSNYTNGISEDDLHKLGELIKSSITIINFIDLTKKEFNKSKFNYFNIKMINSRYNHLDLISHNYNEPIEVTREDYINLKKNQPFYIENAGTLTTIDNTYKVIKDEFKTINDQWKKDNNFDTLFILENSKEYDLIQTYDHNTHTFINEFEINNDLYDEIDNIKAYYNYSDKTKNKWYKGVPSGAFVNFKCGDNYTIDDFNKTELIGFYQVQIINIIDKIDTINKLGFVINSIHTLTTSNIDILQKYITFKFLNASNSPECHIPFTKDFLKVYETGELKKSKIKGYCKAYGLMLGSYENIIELKPLENDMKYYSTFDNENYNMYIDSYGIVKIQDTTAVAKRYIHIAETIHGYLTTIILEQILSMDINMVFGVKLDSIVVKKDYKFNYDKEIFNIKKCKIEKMLNNVSKETSNLDYGVTTNDIIYTGEGLFRPYKLYNECTCDFPKMFTQNGEYIYKKVVLIDGMGGSGKTRSLLSGFFPVKQICYSTICWNLIEGMTSNYEGITGLSLPKLLGEIELDESTKATEQIRVISNKINVLDEATLISNDTIQKAIDEFPHRLTFILGDIDKNDFYYQCSLTDEIIKPSQNKNIQCIEYTKAYRFDSELNDKLLGLRECMRNDENINDFVKQNFKQCYKNKENVIFNNSDVGICAEINHGLELTNYFLQKGTEPQYFTKYTNIRKGEMRGRRLLQKPTEGLNFENKLFKTIHSFQGLQLEENENKIIIYIKNTWDPNLWYTALSRARRVNQIIIIK